MFRLGFLAVAVALASLSLVSGASGTPAERAARAPTPVLLTYVASHRAKSNFRVCAARKDGTHRLRLLSTRSRPIGNLAWSPDGARLAYSSLSASGDRGIYVSNTRLTTASRLTPHFSTPSWAPSWSPDGAWIAFVAGAYGSSGFIVSSDGSHGLHGEPSPTRIPFPAPGIASYIDQVEWFPGSERLLINEFPDGFPEAYSVRVDGTDERHLLHGAQGLSLSPDGSQIAYVLPAPGRQGAVDMNLYVADAQGDHAHLVALRAFTPAWSPDGRWIAFTRYQTGEVDSDVAVVRPDGTGLHTVVHSRNYPASTPAWRRARPLSLARRAAC